MSEKLLPINPHASRSISFVVLFRTIYCNLQLIFQMTRREVLGRYKGSVFGLVWSLFNPILMLTIYTFVFAVIFKARWAGTLGDSKLEFALILFVGIAVYTILADSINQSPSLIINNSNYVKRVVFPLEILPLVALGSALFHLIVSLGVWCIFYLLFFGVPTNYALLFPILIAPLILIILGFSWMLSALGVYMRDVSQFINALVTVLLFLSPVFYPLSSLPEKFQIYLQLNPLTIPCEIIRNSLIWGAAPNWESFGIYFAISIAIAYMGFALFQKTRKGFADVI
jgi:lipopolysaccharide transport system permease protein